MSGVVDVERPDRRLDLAGELLEHQVLVLHLGDEAGGLEEARAVPNRQADGRARRRPLGAEPGRPQAGRRCRLGVEDGLDVVDQAVVLGVEDLVDRRQGDVLVAAAVTTDEVRVEHLVVVGAGRLVARSRPTACRPVSGVGKAAGTPVVVGVDRARVGVVRDVRQEGRVEVQDVRRHRDGAGGVALDEAGGRDVLRQAAQRARDEVAVRVGGEHRDVRHVRVDQLQAEHSRLPAAWPTPTWRSRSVPSGEPV